MPTIRGRLIASSYWFRAVGSGWIGRANYQMISILVPRIHGRVCSMRVHFVQSSVGWNMVDYAIFLGNFDDVENQIRH